MTDGIVRTYNLGDLLELVAATVPDRLAVVAGPVRYTFREFDERTNQVARAFIDLGLEPGAKVAMYSWNRAEWAEVFFGAFKARVVPINVNYRYVAHELQYILENSDAEVLVFERSFAATVAEILPSLPNIRATVVIEDGSDADAGAAVALPGARRVPAGRRPGDPAVVRRPLLPVHRGHHGHAEGRDVAQRGPLLRRPVGGGRAHLRAGGDRREDAAGGVRPAQPDRRPAHARRRPVGDGQHPLRRCGGRPLHRAGSRRRRGLGHRRARALHGPHHRRRRHGSAPGRRSGGHQPHPGLLGLLPDRLRWWGVLAGGAGVAQGRRSRTCR